MRKSRTDNSIKNASAALFTQGVNVLLNFFTRTIFINFLGASYLGINGLFSNILSLLSFAELGFGTAIIYMLYSPLSCSDEREVAAVMNFYKKVYTTIGLVIFVFGLILMPFLEIFINETEKLPVNLPPLWTIYLLYVLNSSFSYFFNYKRSIILASQNGHLDSMNTLKYNVARNVLQCISLLLWKSFLLYLVIQIVCTMASNVSMSKKADKLFPYLKIYKDSKISQKSFRIILRNVVAMSMHKMSSVIVSGTDNLLISKFVGLTTTGCYSNYVLITSTLKTLYIQLFSPITASVGNLIVSESKEKLYDFTNRMFFLNGSIAIIFSSCLATLVNPFISLFWGTKYVFGNFTVTLIVCSFFLNCMRQTMIILIDAGGLFWRNKWKGVVEATVNLIMSVFLGKTCNMGINGIILGTIISCITTNLWWDPYVVFKFALHKPCALYFKQYLQYTVIVIVAVFITMQIEYFIPLNIISFIIYCFISVIVPSGLIYLSFRRNDNLNYFYKILLKKLKKKSHK